MEKNSELRAIQSDSAGSQHTQFWKNHPVAPALGKYALKQFKCCSCSEKGKAATIFERLLATCSQQMLFGSVILHTRSLFKLGHPGTERRMHMQPIQCLQDTSAMSSPSPILSPSFFSQRAMVPICIVGDRAGKATCEE